MARKIPQSIIDEATDYYINNKVRFIDVYEKFQVHARLVSQELKRRNVKIDKQRTRKGHSSWNKGLTRHNDNRIASNAKALSVAKKKNKTRPDGYETVYSDELKKSVKLHHYIWYKNTNYWPNTKKGEQVHHIDGNKNNNDFDNLLLVSIDEHSKIHKEYEQVFIELLKLNLIKFDKNKRGIDWQSFHQMIEKLKV